MRRGNRMLVVEAKQILMAALFLCLGVILAGCESHRAAREQAREAYAAGQAQAAARQQQTLLQLQHPTVTVQGPVLNGVVPWSDGLTLRQAIVAAQYTGFMNPASIRVVREGQMVGQFRGIDLLHGQDMALRPGDLVLVTQ